MRRRRPMLAIQRRLPGPPPPCCYERSAVCSCQAGPRARKSRAGLATHWRHATSTCFFLTLYAAYGVSLLFRTRSRYSLLFCLYFPLLLLLTYFSILLLPLGSTLSNNLTALTSLLCEMRAGFCSKKARNLNQCILRRNLHAITRLH